jgi:hypothetical protein
MPPFNVQLAPSTLAQTINPWSWTFGQVGLFNINLGVAGNPALEERILDEVGSYGRQLGRMGDALKVLIDQLDESRLKPEQKAAIDALRLQLEHVDVIKREGPAS